MRLSALDLTALIDHVVDVAPHLDQLGYHRYWISEHQPQPNAATFVAIAAGCTVNIRVGTGGLLLHYADPVVAAFNLQLLGRVYDDRIDAGFCPGRVDTSTLEPDLYGRDLDALHAAYPERSARFVTALRNVLGSDGYEPTGSWGGAGYVAPQAWSLGSSPRSAARAGAMSVGFAYALLYPSSVDDPSIFATYRAAFVASATQRAPTTMLAVAGVCADSDNEAFAIASAWEASHPFVRPRVVGTPTRCASMLRDLASSYDADEIIFADVCADLPTRLHHYSLLADAMCLTRPG